MQREKTLAKAAIEFCVLGEPERKNAQRCAIGTRVCLWSRNENRNQPLSRRPGARTARWQVETAHPLAPECRHVALRPVAARNAARDTAHVDVATARVGKHWLGTAHDLSRGATQSRVRIDWTRAQRDPRARITWPVAAGPCAGVARCHGRKSAGAECAARTVQHGTGEQSAALRTGCGTRGRRISHPFSARYKNGRLTSIR